MNKVIWMFCCLCFIGCQGEEGSTRIFDIELINVTSSQPLSPPWLATHKLTESAWEVGLPASVGLEILAEGGDASQMSMTVLDKMIGDGVLAPGQAQQYRLSAPHSSRIGLTVASMLVNTNDAFSGISGIPLDPMAVGETRNYLAPIWDAGTERNTETMATVPGPAGGGEGYNADRDDVNRVAYHPGVVSVEDGLTGSVLDAAHIFDQGAVTISITRRQ